MNNNQNMTSNNKDKNILINGEFNRRIYNANDIKKGIRRL